MDIRKTLEEASAQIRMAGGIVTRHEIRDRCDGHVLAEYGKHLPLSLLRFYSEANGISFEWDSVDRSGGLKIRPIQEMKWQLSDMGDARFLVLDDLHHGFFSGYVLASNLRYDMEQIYYAEYGNVRHSTMPVCADVHEYISAGLRYLYESGWPDEYGLARRDIL